MRVTNKHNYPDFVIEWLSKDDYDYDPETLSATTIMSPARAYALKKKYWDELEIDASDLIASRYGTAIHDSVEKVKLKDCIQEQRLSTELAGKKITGKFDILHNIGTPGNPVYELIDVKSTSVWTYIYNRKEEDYIKQLSIYRYLAIKNGFQIVPKAKIWMVFTDWSKSRAKKDEDYPQTRIAIKEIMLWDTKKTEDWIIQRIHELEHAATLPDEELPECTSEELWATKDQWAVMRRGRTSAIKLFDERKDAEEFIKGKQLTHSIVLRKGQAKRCHYCPARKFCNQYQKLKQEGRIEDD